ncbi:MAG: TAT-variant-translocated molybdopterin oxidoreductase, partial [Minisyncoccia bacterium]
MSQDKFKNYWKSLRDYYNPEELKKIKEDEFLEGTIENIDLGGMPPISRRRFLALLSASSAFAFAACSNFKDKGEIVPYNKKPEEIILGNANFYASSLNCCKNNCSVLVKTREGRPIKIDGNPDHPINQGKVCVRGQAAILNLYDPDRLKSPLQNISNRQFAPVSWREANKTITETLQKTVAQNKEIALIANKINSPTALLVLKEFQQKYPTTKFYFYSNFSDRTKLDAWREVYGINYLPSIKLEKSKVILALESDFLNTEGDVIENVRKFAQTRNVNDLKNFSRLYVVEGNLTLTGVNSDYRLKLRPDYQKEFLLSLLNEILSKVNSKVSLPSELLSQIKNYDLNSFVSKYKLSKDVITTLVNDLINN